MTHVNLPVQSLEAAVAQAWNEYCGYLETLAAQRPNGSALAAPEYLWRVLLRLGCLGPDRALLLGETAALLERGSFRDDDWLLVRDFLAIPEVAASKEPEAKA